MHSKISHMPVIGVASGYLSFILGNFMNLLTDEKILKAVAALGVWMGTLVAVISLALRIWDFLDKRKANRKSLKNDQ